MKKLTLTLLTVILLALNGCTTLQGFFTSENEKFLKQSFGDALRSLEGAGVDQIPTLVQKLRDKWLPQGQFWSDFAASQIRAFLAAHPTTPTEAKKVLEAIA